MQQFVLLSRDQPRFQTVLGPKSYVCAWLRPFHLCSRWPAERGFGVNGRFCVWFGGLRALWWPHCSGRPDRRRVGPAAQPVDDCSAWSALSYIDSASSSQLEDDTMVRRRLSCSSPPCKSSRETVLAHVRSRRLSDVVCGVREDQVALWRKEFDLLAKRNCWVQLLKRSSNAPQPRLEAPDPIFTHNTSNDAVPRKDVPSRG